MGVIDIGNVLAHFDDTYDEVSLAVRKYHIRFITRDGRLRTMICRKNVAAPSRGLRAPLQPKGRQLFNLKRHGTMLVHDLEKDEPRTVKVATICHFKESHPSTSSGGQWLNVRH